MPDTRPAGRGATAKTGPAQTRRAPADGEGIRLPVRHDPLEATAKWHQL